LYHEEGEESRRGVYRLVEGFGTFATWDMRQFLFGGENVAVI
jgi:hypothetical protein